MWLEQMSVVAKVLVVSAGVAAVVVLVALVRSYLRQRRIEALVTQEEMRREFRSSGGFVAPPSDAFRNECRPHEEAGHFSSVRPSGVLK